MAVNRLANLEIPIQNRLADLEVPAVIADPSAPPRITNRLADLEIPTTPSLASRILGKTAGLSWEGLKLGWKGLGYGFGAIGYPFKSVSHAIGTPLDQALRSRIKTITGEEEGVAGIELFKPGVTPEEAAREYKEIWPALKTGLSSFARFKEDPEGAKTMVDVFGTYYKGLTGEKAPAYYKYPAGIGAEFLIVPTIVGKMFKALGIIPKGIANVVREGRIPNWQAWKEAKLFARAEIGGRRIVAEELGKSLSGKHIKQIAEQLSIKTGKHISPKAVKLRLGQIIRGSITQQEPLARTANPIIKEFTAVGKELRAVGILGKETFLTKLPKKRIAQLLTQKGKLQKQLTKLQKRKAFPGKTQKVKEATQKIDKITDKIQQSYKAGAEKYLPRLYQEKEELTGARRRFGFFMGRRIRAPYAKKREVIPFAVRKAMGEIKEPAYPVAKRLSQVGADIETAKLFEQVARNPQWSADVWRAGLAAKALPNTKAYGALAGKYVVPGVFNDVTEITRIRNSVERIYDTAIGTWKLGKVVWNPATHFRNKFSNKILLDLSGMGYGEQAKYAYKALQHYRANSEDYQTAKKYFARTTLIKGELLDDFLRTSKEAETEGVGKVISAINKSIGRVSAKPAAIYQHEEFANKFMKYLQVRDKGGSVLDAVREGNKWLFDYGDLATWEKKYMRRIMPFYTFPRKALPRVAEAMAERPHTIAKYPLLAWTLEKYSLHKLELSEKDYAEIKRTLPKYMKSGSYILMPYRDKNNDLRFFDWTYLVPWGEIAEVQERGPLKSVVTNPLIQVVGDIQRNKSSWSGRKIWNDTDTKREKWGKGVLYTWQAAAPSLAYKGIYWDKLAESVMGRPLKSIERKKFRPLPETILHTIFGLRTQAIDPVTQKRFFLMGQEREMRELGWKMRDSVVRFNSGNIDQKEYDKQMNQYMKQFQDTITEITE